MDYVDSILRGASVNGIVPVGDMTIGELIAQAQGQLPGSAPPTVPFGRSARDLLRRAPLGFPAASVAANASATSVSQQLSRVFHPNRLLIIPSAPGLVIDSIRIGDEEQTLTPGTPVELYGVEALTDSLPDNFSPVQTGTTVTLLLRNTTGATITATIGMKGGVQR